MQQVLAFEDGFKITVPISPNQQGRVLPKATRYGLVIGGRQHYSAPKTLGATTLTDEKSTHILDRPHPLNH